ncbi:MAG: prepilin-type N-terminal cleavage/methylation domain-containing protein [Candidatus Omnitrophica bacterium]|nr:prepilin-type N-terminal cleavage/methylation domain-containing protein [Candidatus Omnitrophota bacterium]
MDKKGFTLVEILIVLVVAGILLALILPNTLKAIDRGNQTADQSNVNTLQTAVFMCYTETRNWGDCGDQESLLAENYLEELVVSPYDGKGYVFTPINDVDSDLQIGIKVSSTAFPE